jgi:Tol biopolymer transport system component
MSWLPTVSASGHIALSRFQWVVHLWDVELDPTTGRAVGAPNRITDDASPKFTFSLTRDGDLLAYSTYTGSPDNRRAGIWLYNRATGEGNSPISLPVNTTSLHPRLSSDGSLLSWRYRTDGRWITYVAPTKEPVGQVLCEGCLVVDFFSGGNEVLVDWGRRLSRLRIADGRETPILEVEEGRALLDTDLSRDDRWLAILTGEPDGKVAISVVPLRESPISTEEWVEIAGRDTWVGAPRWSPDGRTLYYLSDRDDFICLWAQSLDADTKEPMGDPFAVVHAHASSMNMLPMNRSMWNLEVGTGRLIFNAGELTGDVYTAMLEEE